MIGFALCGVSVACYFLKTMTTDKPYQHIDLYVNLHSQSLIWPATTPHYLLSFGPEQIRPRMIKLAFIKQQQNVTKVALFVLLS